MAITAAALQAALGTDAGNARVLEMEVNVGTVQRYYVCGQVDVPGRTRWCETTASDNAATQAATVLTALRAS